MSNRHQNTLKFLDDVQDISNTRFGILIWER